MKKEKILSQMENIVADLMKSFQSDFFNHDVPAIQEAKANDFPMIWQVGECHTHLLKVVEYARTFKDDEWKRYDYVKEGMPFECYFDQRMFKGDHYFLLTDDGVYPISIPQCRELIRDIMLPEIEKYKATVGTLPKHVKLPIKFINISLFELKAIIKKDVEEMGNTLLTELKKLHQRRRTASNEFVQISYDSYLNKFCCSHITNGKAGLYNEIKFHGTPDTGYLTASSIQIDPRYGWASHS